MLTFQLFHNGLRKQINNVFNSVYQIFPTVSTAEICLAWFPLAMILRIAYSMMQTLPRSQDFATLSSRDDYQH